MLFSIYHLVMTRVKIQWVLKMKRKDILGNSLVAQWLRLRAFRPGPRFNPVRDLRAYKLCSAAKKKKKVKNTHYITPG